MQRLGRGEFDTLESLEREKSISELVKSTGIRMEQFVREDGILDNLKDMGFINIKKSEKDKRVRLINLSKEGTTFLNILKKVRDIS